VIARFDGHCGRCEGHIDAGLHDIEWDADLDAWLHAACDEDTDVYAAIERGGLIVVVARNETRCERCFCLHVGEC